MQLLNLTLGQFLALFAGLSAGLLALYLLDRSRRKQVVATLRFWTQATRPPVASRRRHIQQPWSLLLQIASLVLLLLAIAQLRIGAPESAPRDHVLILDTSAWMAAHTSGRAATLMDAAHQRARSYIRAVPARDRIMLVRADALTTPATAFESDRRKLDAAIAASQPGATAVNLEQAVLFARRMQSQSGRRAGEVAFIGTGKLAESQPANASLRNLRFLAVPDNVQNCGLRRAGARRSDSQPDLWQIYVSVRNYGSAPCSTSLSLTFGPSPDGPGQSPAGSRRLMLPAGAEREAAFAYRTSAAGFLSIELSPPDAFVADDRAALRLPARTSLRVAVYSTRPELLRPLLAASPQVEAVFHDPSEYGARTAHPAQANEALVILDGFRPQTLPTSDSIWIDPPAADSPVPVRSRVSNAPLTSWLAGNPLGAGLHTRDLRLESASVFEAAPDDLKIAEVEDGPVIVARPGKPKMVVLGFHPALPATRYALSTPLLFANLLRWMAPAIFRRGEFNASSVGAVKVALDADARPADVRVTRDDDGSPVPFTLRSGTLEFFSAVPGTVRVVSENREYVHSLTLPQLGEARWDAPPGTRRGLPKLMPGAPEAAGLWQWLALLGGAGLLAEWLLFGSLRRRPMRLAKPVVAMRKAS